MVWGDTVQDATLLMILNGVAACLSLIGSSLMWYFCRTVYSRKIHFKLICGIAISDFCFSISNVMSTFEGSSLNALCIAEAFIRAWSYVFSIIFTTSIAILCYKISQQKQSFDQEKFLKKTVAFGVLLGSFLVSAPLYIPEIKYTNGSIYCYITYAPGISKIEMLLVRMMYEGVIIFGGLIITLVAYILTAKRLRNTPAYILGGRQINPTKFFWYPAVLFIAFIPSIMDNYTRIFTDDNEAVYLKAIHLVLTHSIGFINAIVYGFQMKEYHFEVVSTTLEPTTQKAIDLMGSVSSEDHFLKEAYLEN